MKSALKILESMTLRFSELNRMNDINESCKSIFYELPPLFEKEVENFSLDIEIEEEISKYRQISLTMDGNKRGFYIPAMWAHYANKGDGVCIVLDRKKLLNKIPANIEHHKVCYSDDYDNNITVPYNGASEYLRVNSREFFFTKTSDWSYEQEYRLFSFDSDIEDISIEGCVVAVIMLYTDGVRRGESVTKSVDYGILNKIAKPIPILQIMQFYGNISLVDENSNPVWESNPINL